MAQNMCLKRFFVCHSVSVRGLVYAHVTECFLFAVLQNIEYIRIDGNTPSERRQTVIARFQECSKCKVALLSITAANMGITLSAASLVVFAELFWNPGVRTVCFCFVIYLY